MLSVSDAFHNAVSQNSKVALRATLTLADGTVKELVGADFAMGGLTITEGTSSGTSFDVGACVVGSATVTLANYGGEFDDYDFTDATVVPYVGVELLNSTEWLRRGTYGINQPSSYGATITLECDDNMRLLERPYSEVVTTYPATLGTIVRDLTTHCGVQMLRASFSNDSYVVTSRPDDSRLTCRDVLSYAVQVAGCFAKFDPFGRLDIRWYDTSTFEVDEPNGPEWVRVETIHSLTTATDDVVVTGVSVTASDQITAEGTTGLDGETSLYGSTGYVLSIEGNPLVVYGAASGVASQIGLACVGMRFRPYETSVVGDPAIEAGDPILLTDGMGRTYRSWVTQLTWRAGAHESLACGAETPARNSAASYAATTREIVKLRKQLRAEQTARAIAIENLAHLIADPTGLYETDVTLQDGSVIRYYHDQPTLAESRIVWKFTANAFVFSNDGGQTYPYGIDVTGNALLERIYTVGLDASYVNSGRLVVGDSENPMLVVDMDTGEVTINQLASLGGRSVQSVLADVDGGKVELVEYGTSASSSTEPSSWSTTVPTSVTKGTWLWVRTTYGDGTTSTTKVYVGRDGTSSTISSIRYGTSADASTQPSSWSTTSPTSLEKGTWLWVKTTYSNGSVATTKSYVGTDGEDGTSVAVVSATKSGGVSTVVLSDGTTLTIEDGEDGTNGTPGANGYVHVAWATSADGSQGFSTTVSTGKTYVGMYTDNTQPDSQNYRDYSWSLIKGTDGRDGRGISSATISYGTSSSASTQPSSWSQSVPTSIAKGTWLWVRTVTTYTDSTTSTTYTKSYVGTDGEDGTSIYVTSSTKVDGTTTIDLSDGTTITIEDGEDGANGINGTSGYVHTAWANSADGVTDFSTTVSAGKSYLGVYTDSTEADSTQPSSYSWSLIKGADGASPSSYSVVAVPAALVRSSGGTLSPSSVTFSAKRSQGAGNPTNYAGRFIIAEYNGSSWSTKYTSSANESSKSYSPTSTAQLVRCTLYMAGGTSTVLDVQTVPIASDGTDGRNGADAYTVVLTNESHTFAAGASAAVAGSTTCSVIAYKGATRVAATIGTISGKPTGMSTTITSNGTTGAYFTVTVTASLTTRQGVLTVPVTVDGKSFTRTFSWSLALKGDTGDEGVGIASIAEQYYLSTSNTAQTGGSWSDAQPSWQSDRYIWTRSLITWDTDPSTTSTTTPVLAKALNGANSTASNAQSTANGAQYLANVANSTANSAQSTADTARTEAADAAKVATNYLTYSSANGLEVGYSGTSAKTRVTGSGVEVFDGNGDSVLYAGVSNGVSVTRTGKASNSGNVVMSSEGYVDIRNASRVMAHFGYAEGTNQSGGRSAGPYYDIGIRSSGTTVGNYSVAEGFWTEASGVDSHSEGYASIASNRASHSEGSGNIASGMCSHAEGGYVSMVGDLPNPEVGVGNTASGSYSHAEGSKTEASNIASHAEGSDTKASGYNSHAEGNRSEASGSESHAEGSDTKASGYTSHAEGEYAEASGRSSHAEGYHTVAAGAYQHVSGIYNVSDTTSLIIVGRGSWTNRMNALTLDTSGNLWISGSLTQNSDRRLKDHHAYLGEDACEFVRGLRPALFSKDGERHVGFYAQNVAEAEPEGWDTVTVASRHTDESLGYDPLTLDYTAIIAPLVAYTQELERCIEAQGRQIEKLTLRLDTIEGS